MEIGKMNTLSVLRETDIAYQLTDGTEEVFLHKKEAKKPYLDGESIDVFLYVDNLGRTTASTKIPLLEVNQVAMLEVMAVKPRLGVFLYYGMIKDLLLSLDELPEDLNKWPKPGDKVIVEMILDNGQLFGKILGRKQITERFDESEVLEDGSFVECNVMYLIDNGMVCFTPKGEEIFIHKNNYRKPYRIGEAVLPKILKRNPDGEYVGTLIEQKEIVMTSDAETIIEYLEYHGKQMPYTDKTDPETISKVFHMSKAAFKRALGTLYKSNKVILEKDKTLLK